MIYLAGTKKIPQRQCKKNGRGAYICPNADCFAKAVASKGLERSFKMPIEKSVYDKLAKELENIEAG